MIIIGNSCCYPPKTSLKTAICSFFFFKSMPLRNNTQQIGSNLQEYITHSTHLQVHRDIGTNTLLAILSNKKNALCYMKTSAAVFQYQIHLSGSTCESITHLVQHIFHYLHFCCPFTVAGDLFTEFHYVHLINFSRKVIYLLLYLSLSNICI